MDDNKFDENGRKFSKRVEYNDAKGEIAHYKKLLLFPQCFQRTCTETLEKQELLWERGNDTWELNLQKNMEKRIKCHFSFSHNV